jgi:alkanesulfonate monooxygenase SsuD/methylene tetrahydromethanopterin reductase-like flavin-dependent oxidoreductase (luciferase family)
MKFGVFDHVDDSGLPPAAHMAARLDMVAAYDAAGFHAYHVAEHHGTPLGHSPSPAVYLAAVSQRTTRLRFGPLVFLLPLYHPLRLIEEIGMLDALSDGRLELGYGRGISPIEMGFYGVAMEEQAERTAEAFAVVMKGLTSERLTHQGRFFQFDDVPMLHRPLQQPHPPLWYGTNSAASVERCAQDRVNMVTLLTGEPMRAMLTCYREIYDGAPEDMPLLGVGRHVVVADSDEEAEAIARPAFARWRASFVHLWEARGGANPFVANFPMDWDAFVADGGGVAGSPATVRAFIEREHSLGGFTYFMAQMAFGGMTADEVRRSAELFGREVMPPFAQF